MGWFRNILFTLLIVHVLLGTGCLVDTVGKNPGKTVYGIRDNYCTLCELCVDPCPHDAIVILQKADGGTVIYIDDEKCVGCGECYNYCVYEAIYIKDKESN